MSMICASDLSRAIIARLPFEPNTLQARLIAQLGEFVAAMPYRGVFLLNGYAGSGKTSIVGALIRSMADLRRNTVMLAPTGRAAKVAADMALGKASTIHKRIYRPESSSPDARYFLAANKDRDTLFIVDEASLITDGAPASSLLFQLLRYVFSNEGNALLLVGDTAQLPPVGMTTSPAMDPERLRMLGLRPAVFTLDLPMRQSENSGILFNATVMRHAISTPPEAGLPTLFASRFDDVESISSADLADRLTDSWNEVGVDNTIIITRSNWRANKYNLAIRNMVMYAEEPLQQGDRIVIAKNDYYWSKVNKVKTFIANGDMAEVKWVGRTEKMYGRFFTDVELYFPSMDQHMGAKIMLRSLNAEGPAIPRSEMERFYAIVMSEQEGTDSERINAALDDPFYNALQAKYGYCVTCHKAQGGQWRHVYIDMAGLPPDGLAATFYRWAYTAMTRATERLFFINSSLPVK
ncbi:MAG: AAA family ATPase [Muribaculaceae bacterium]|nr:AAA family ATPase [Muribaculaceae bacterium]